MHRTILSDHFVSVGAISAGDGSQYDFIRAMDHYNKLLMGTGPNKVSCGNFENSLNHVVSRGYNK